MESTVVVFFVLVPVCMNCVVVQLNTPPDVRLDPNEALAEIQMIF